MSLAQNLEAVRTRVAQAAQRGGRSPSEIHLIAVTKTHPAEVVKEAMGLGLSDFGENYLQEALEKKRAVGPGEVRWHFIGHLQTNKVKSMVGEFALIHSVDSQRLAFEISKRAEQRNVLQKILLQVNIGGEETKGGVEPEQAAEVARAVIQLPHVSLQGLMCLPPTRTEVAKMRQDFRQLREMRENLQAMLTDRDLERHPMHELSMGMSGDFEAAIEEGATLIRLGTILFGLRQGL